MHADRNRRLHPASSVAGFEFTFEGRAVRANPGESVAAALLADGTLTLRLAEDGSPRGLLCGIGVCWECRCVVDGVANSRACMTAAAPGMVVERQLGTGREGTKR